MSDRQFETNERAESTTASHAEAAFYVKAKTTTEAFHSQTSITGIAHRESVMSSRTQGSIQVRMVPVSPHEPNPDTAA